MHRLEGQRFLLEKKLQKNLQDQAMVRKKKSGIELITSTEKDAAFAAMVEAQSELEEAVVYHKSVQKGLQNAKDCLEKTQIWKNASGQDICEDLALEYSHEALESLTVTTLVDIKSLLEAQKPSLKGVFSRQRVGVKTHAREIAEKLGMSIPESTVPTEDSLAAFLESVQSCTEDEDAN